MRYFYSLWIMGRPLFLMGIVPLYALGITAAWHEKKVILMPLIVAGLGLVWLIQLMTNYNNEYWDLETDLVTETHTRISGGSRALVRGLVPRITARKAALTCLGLALALSGVMIAVMGAGVGLLGFLGVASALGWFYSAKPLRLESIGLGELVNVVVSCFLLSSMSYYLQTSTFNSSLLIVCIPLSLFTLALILTTEIPDSQADQVTGKKTLVVLLGSVYTKRIIVLALLAGWLGFSALIIYSWALWGWLATAVSLPLLIIIEMRIRDTGFLFPAKIEKTGLLISLLLGYAAICFNIVFLGN